MKVLVFSKHFGALTLTFIHNEVTEIARHHDVTVLSTARGNTGKVAFDNIEELPFRQNPVLQRILFELYRKDLLISEWNPAFGAKLDKLISRLQPDLIHCHFGNESLQFLDNFNRWDIPVLVSFHGYDASQFVHLKSYARKMRSLFSREKVFPIACSEYLMSRVAEMGVDTAKGFVLPYGVELSKFTRNTYPGKENGIRFTQVSSFSNQKGHDVTVEAIRKFVDRNPGLKVEFVFGGAGDEALERIRKLVHEKNLQHIIRFTGKIDHQEVRDLLETTHFFIHHSVTGPHGETEGLPNAIIEAMAMELPVLSTWHAGIPELIEDGKHGYLVKERDVDTYVQRMEDMLSWNYLPGNRTKVMEMCSMDIHTQKLNSIYRKVTGKN